MSPLQIALVIALTAAGAIVHGSIGIGLGLVAAPALVAIDPAFTPGPLLIAAQLVGIRHIAAEWRHADFDAVKRGLIGVPVGIIGAITILELMSRRLLALTVGTLTALAAAMLLAGFAMARTPRSEIVAGGICAFSSLTAALPGPPLVCVYADMAPSKLRPTTALLIMVVATTGLVTLILSGNFGSHEVSLLGWLVPGVLVGLVLARFVRPHIDRPWFRQAVLVVALLGGLALAIRQIFA